MICYSLWIAHTQTIHNIKPLMIEIINTGYLATVLYSGSSPQPFTKTALQTKHTLHWHWHVIEHYFWNFNLSYLGPNKLASRSYYLILSLSFVPGSLPGICCWSRGITTWNMSPSEKKEIKNLINLFANNHTNMQKKCLNGFVSYRSRGLCHIDCYDKHLKTMLFTVSMAQYQQTCNLTV